MENRGNMKNTHMMQDGGVIGQEIVFDDNGEQNKGVIKDIHEITGNYIVSTDDGRTVLADKERDVISLGAIRKQAEAKKRFSFFEHGGNLDSMSLNQLLDKVPVFERMHIDGYSNYARSKEAFDDLVKEFGNKRYSEEESRQYDNFKKRKVMYENSYKQNVIKYLQSGKMEDGGNIAKENNEMLHSQAKEAKHHIEELHNIINNKTKVEPWVVAKMTRAKTDLSDITHYLDGNTSKMQNGGKLTDAQQNKFDKVMHEWKQGKLHSGSKNGPIVKDQDQAIAIAYSEAYGMDKMLFGGMVNELSDDTIDRMEGLIPISTLQELLDNAKFIIADMYEEGFEKDEIMSFLAYKISQIGGGNIMSSGSNSSSVKSESKPKILVDLYNELSKAKNIESLEWDYDADEGHYIIFENGLESQSDYHKGQNDQFAFYANEDGKIDAVYILSGNDNPNLTVKEAVKYARANEDVRQWTMKDEDALDGWISDIQDGYGWITPGYVESSWTSRPGSGTKEWNGDIQERVYQRLIDENMLFAENPNDYEKKGKKIKSVTTAIWTASEENGYEYGGKMATGGGVGKNTYGKVYQLTGTYGAIGIPGKVLYGFKKEIDKLDLKGTTNDMLNQINTLWNKWSVSDGSKIIENEVIKVVKNNSDIEYITATLNQVKWEADTINRLNSANVKDRLYVRIPSDFVINIGFNQAGDASKFYKKLGGITNPPINYNQTEFFGNYKNVGRNNVEIRESLFLLIEIKEGKKKMATGGAMTGWKHRAKK